jgi:hypothetical protein
MGAHLPGREAQDIFANGGDAVPDPEESLFRSDQADGTVGALVGAYWRVSGGAWKGANAFDDRGPGNDGTEDGVSSAVLCDDGVAVIVLLKFEGNGNAVGEVKGGVAVEELDAGTEEAEVAEEKEFGAPCFRGGDLQVLAGSHRKEEGAADELVDGFVEGGAVDGC